MMIHMALCAQVIQDLQEECSKYGRVLRVLVPRPPNPAASNELFGSNNYGKVRRLTPPLSPSVLLHQVYRVAS